MKKMMFLFGSLLMILLVFQVAGGPASEKADPSIDGAPVEPAAAEPEPAPVLEPQEGGMSTAELLPEATLFSEPQPAATCVLSECRHYCWQECPVGCICRPRCVWDVCDCAVSCP